MATAPPVLGLSSAGDVRQYSELIEKQIDEQRRKERWQSIEKGLREKVEIEKYKAELQRYQEREKIEAQRYNELKRYNIIMGFIAVASLVVAILK